MPEAIARGSSHGFVALPAALLRELPQPGGQRRLIAYALIHAHGNGSARGCFAALGTLAREAGLSERTVKRAIAELLERGWIKRELRPGHSNRYWALSTSRLTAGNRVAASQRQGEQGLLTASSAYHPAVSSEVPYPGQHSTPYPGQQSTTTQATTDPPPRPAGHPHPGHQNLTNKNPLTTPPQPDPSSSSRSLLRCSLSGSADTAADSQAAAPDKQSDPRSAQPPNSPLAPSFEPLDALTPQPPGSAKPRATRLPVTISELPPQLQPLAERIEAYWLSKPGSRSRAAFSVMLEELELVLLRAGRQGVSQLLRQATQAGWALLNSEAWLAQHREELAQAKHPAYQVFRAP